EKFGEPELLGIDYPAIEVRTCFYDRATENILVKLNVSKAVGETSFSIANFAHNASVAVSIDGRPAEKLLNADANGELVLACTSGEHYFIIHQV
ncbi:MAG: hypothetical protein PHH26_05175, partial [Candidatus Thermoplasmatota archaeon]|nr:hypothetical protein [Candidatus Thermoplasmatota archaeon]